MDVERKTTGLDPTTRQSPPEETGIITGQQIRERDANSITIFRSSAVSTNPVADKIDREEVEAPTGDYLSHLINQAPMGFSPQQQHFAFNSRNNMDKEGKIGEQSWKQFFRTNFPYGSEEDRQKRALKTQLEESDSIDDFIIRCNVRLVAKIAYHYVFPGGLSFKELFIAGSDGLRIAIEKFDINRNVPLSNYAALLIKQSITREIAENSRNIRIPEYLRRKLLNIRTALEKLTGEIGRPPTDDELSEFLIKNYGYKDTDAAMSDIQISRLPTIKPQDSLDRQILENGSTLGDLLPDKKYTDERTAADVANRALLEQYMGQLSKKQRQMIELIFGLNNNPPETLENAGKTLGISKEGARRLKERAEKKLRTAFAQAR